MRLTTHDLAELPLPALWVDTDGRRVTATPEWIDGGSDTVQYRVGQLRGVIATPDHDPHLASVSRMVLDELDASVSRAKEGGDEQRARRALRAGLRLVAGYPDPELRSTADIVSTVQAAARCENVEVTSPSGTDGEEMIVGGDTLALAL